MCIQNFRFVHSVAAAVYLFWFAKHYSTTIATESRRTRLNQPVHLACPAQRRAAADDPVRAGEWSRPLQPARLGHVPVLRQVLVPPNLQAVVHSGRTHLHRRRRELQHHGVRASRHLWSADTSGRRPASLRGADGHLCPHHRVTWWELCSCFSSLFSNFYLFLCSWMGFSVDHANEITVGTLT